MLINYILIPRLYIRVLLATLSLVVPGSLTSSVPIYWGTFEVDSEHFTMMSRMSPPAVVITLRNKIRGSLAAAR